MFNTITTKSLEARKSKNKVLTNLYTTILGEVQQLEKKMSKDKDTITLEVLKKFRDSATQVLSLSPTNEVARQELEVITSLLPVSLTEEQMKTFVEEVVQSWDESKGNITAFVMKWFKTNYSPSQYDAKYVSQLIPKK